MSTRALSTGTGERVSRIAGGGGEFLDYRPYEPGDEPRFVDWNVYARSGKLFTRQFRSERSSRVYAVLDTSASMRDKAADATRIRAFLQNFARQDTWLEREVNGLKDGLTRLALEKPGLVLIVSDGLELLPGIRSGLSALTARGFDVSFVQLLSRDDLEPPTGAWRIADAESSGKREVDDAARRMYLERLARHLEGLAGLLRGLGLRHAQVRDADPGETFARLRRAHILERG